jgi:hypothetical protein
VASKSSAIAKPSVCLVRLVATLCPRVARRETAILVSGRNITGQATQLMRSATWLLATRSRRSNLQLLGDRHRQAIGRRGPNAPVAAAVAHGPTGDDQRWKIRSIALTFQAVIVATSIPIGGSARFPFD